MALTHQVRTWWSQYRCEPGDTTQLLGFTVRFRSEAHDAVKALESALRATNYAPEVIGSHRRCPTGISGKTCQPSGFNCSLHNYSLALDFDPFAKGNDHFQRRFGDGWNFSDCKFTREQVEAVEAIRTNNGKQVWKWLGWSIGDTMHFQLNCSIADLATGIKELGEDMAGLTQEDRDWIMAAIRGDNVDQTNSVWQRYEIYDSAGETVPLIQAIQFIYRKLEAGGSLDVDEAAVAESVLSQINLKQAS